MKSLLIDIETSPNLVYAWGLGKQNITLSHLVKESEILCFAAQTVGERAVTYYGKDVMGHERMVLAAWERLNDADVVETYYGDGFDLPILNAAFLKYGLTPPAPCQSIDWYKVVRRNFRMPSRKLSAVLRLLDLQPKVSHEGMGLWHECLQDDPKAWKTMRRYVRRDVSALAELREILLPWYSGPFNRNLYEDQIRHCPRCGAGEGVLIRQGFRYTATGKYQRYVCAACGGWCSEGRRESGADIRSV